MRQYGGRYRALGGWRLLNKWRGLRDQLAPDRSWSRKLYDSVIGAFRRRGDLSSAPTKKRYFFAALRCGGLLSLGEAKEILNTLSCQGFLATTPAPYLPYPGGQVSKKLAVVQSNYIPWKGYFDLINSVDEFILFDDMQYTRRDWRNRNRIKTPNGVIWLTIPVAAKGKYFQKISETLISDPGWKEHHWKSLVHNYSRAEYFSEYRACFEELYLGCKEQFLSRVNYRFLAVLCQLLGIKTRLMWSSKYRLVEGKTERLVELCRQVGATEYISGPTAEGYIEEKLFHDAGIRLSYMDYSGYPQYRQLYPPFEHEVSILDLIFNEGSNATRFMKSF